MRKAWSVVILWCAASAFGAPQEVDRAFVRTRFSLGPPAGIVGPVALQYDGKLVLAASLMRPVADMSGIAALTRYSLSVRRFEASGGADASFGSGGEVTFAIQGHDVIQDMLVQPDGRIVLAISVREPCVPGPFECVTANNSISDDPTSALVRLMPDGSFDPTFRQPGSGLGAGFALASDIGGATALALQEDGRLLLLGTIDLGRALVFMPKVARFLADGTRDNSFVSALRCNAAGHAMRLQPGGEIVVAGHQDVVFTDPSASPGICIERLNADGSHDGRFREDARLISLGANVRVMRLLQLPDGKLLLVVQLLADATMPTRFVVVGFLPDGQLDDHYGDHGKALLPVSDALFGDAVTTRDGGLLLLLTVMPAHTGAHVPMWVKLTASGGLDAAFGSNGSLVGAALTGNVKAFVRDFQGRWLVVNTTPSEAQLTEVLRYLGFQDGRDRVIEFRNTRLDHYFLTDDAVEADAIERGSAGPGWARTGEGFEAGGTSYTCRFYGSVSPGPNSHFYTVNPAECGALMALQQSTPPTQPRWNLEGYHFATTPPSEGACPASTIPVYRAYNNGFARGIDSNHRFTTSAAIQAQMVAGGWIDEGVRFCAPR